MKGSFTVELSLVLPVILMILVALMQMGLYFTYRIYTVCVVNQSLSVYSRARQEKNTMQGAALLAEEYLYDTLSILPVEIQDFWCEAEGGWLEEDCTVGVTVQFSFMFDMKWSSVGKNCVTNPVSFRNRLDFIWEKGRQYLKRFQEES